MQNIEPTILSQFSNSPIILALLESYNLAVDPSNELDGFYNNIWNIDTATGWGLDNWGAIIGVTRILPLPTVATGYLGFRQQTDGLGFGNSAEIAASPASYGVLYSSANSTSNYALTDDAYRTLLLAKAFANISNCAIPTYNKMLMMLFPGEGNIYVQDLGSMQMKIVSTFTLTPVQNSILMYSGVFAPPTGVSYTVN